MISDNFSDRQKLKLEKKDFRENSQEGLQIFGKSITDIKIGSVNKFRSFRYRLPRYSGLNKKLRERKIIVSLTSYPARINSVVIVLGILLRQTVKPDKIVLYLASDQFRDKKLPLWLRLQVRCGIEIMFCRDLKPHKKYFYAMQKYPDDIIITVDDDVYYDKDLIKSLYLSYQRHPDAVSAARTHLITFDRNSQINSYLDWGKKYSEIIDKPNIRLCATGVGGVIYPPHCMHGELFNEEKIKKLCLTADDLWLKIMQLMNNTAVVRIAENKKLHSIGGSQSNSLWEKNKWANDSQLQNILEEYNEYFGKDDTLLMRLQRDI